MRHSRRATRALQALAEADPAFAALALWCDHRDGETGDAAARTDGRTILYGPAFEALADHEQVGLAAHHVLHVAFRHVPRMQAMALRLGARFDEDLFQIATDALVNETLLLAGYALPRPAVRVSALLEAALGEEAAPRDAVARFDAERLYLRLAAVAGSAGGQRGGDGRPERAGEAAERAKAHAAAQGFAADMDKGAGGEAGAEEALARADWQARIARAFEAGRLAGRGIGAAGLRLADLPEARTPWEVVLRGLVTKAVTHAPCISPTRPARRWLAADSLARERGGPAPAFEPGVARAGARPRVAVCIDCSSSVEDGLFARFVAEIGGIGRRSGAELHVLLFDEAVRAHRRLPDGRAEAELKAMEMPRGGGTSFAEVVPAAARLDPSIIVVLTDLEGPAGPPPASVPVLWAVPDAAAGMTPPYGRLLPLSG